MRRLMFGLLAMFIAIYVWLLFMRPSPDVAYNKETYVTICRGFGAISIIFFVFILFKKNDEWDEERPIARLFFILVTPLTWLYYMLCNIFYGALALFEAFTTEAPKQHFK